MQFLELTENEFDNACNKIPVSSFCQSSSWAKIKKKTGWISYFVGVKENDKVIACALILGKKIYLNKYIFYSPRGLLLDYKNKKLLKFFTDHIKTFLKNKGGIILKIDPLIMYKHHDNSGNYVSDGFSNQSIIDSLVKLGFEHNGFTKDILEDTQFRWSYCLDVDKPMEEILKGMNQRARRCIRKCEKYPLEVVDVNKDNIKDFKDIMQHTAERQNRFDRSLEYYQRMKDEFGDRVKMIIIYLDRDKFLSDFTNDKLFNTVKNEKRNKIPISAGLFVFDPDRLNYLYGGTYSHYMHLMAQYKLQMSMINACREKNLPIYDFGGISGDFNEHNPMYGVFGFKRGFGGYVVEYIGEFTYIFDKLSYKLYNLAYKLYRTINHIRFKMSN